MSEKKLVRSKNLRKKVLIHNMIETSKTLLTKKILKSVERSKAHKKCQLQTVLY